jgi:hypothetical protein
MPLIWMKRGLPSEKHRAGDRTRHVLGLDRQLDVAVEDARLVALDLGEDDALFLDHDRRRNHVDVGDLAADQAGKARCQRLGVHPGGDAVITGSRFP